MRERKAEFERLSLSTFMDTRMDFSEAFRKMSFLKEFFS